MVRYPRCIAGKRACPPEGCGGPWGYGDFLEAIQNPSHPEHEDMVEWIGGEFDPDFSRSGSASALRRLANSSDWRRSSMRKPSVDIGRRLLHRKPEHDGSLHQAAQVANLPNRPQRLSY